MSSPRHVDATSDDALIGPVARAYIRAIQARQPPPTALPHGSTWRSRWESRSAGGAVHRVESTPHPRYSADEKTHPSTPRTRAVPSHREHASPATPPSTPRLQSPNTSLTPSRQSARRAWPSASVSPRGGQSVPRHIWGDEARRWSPMQISGTRQPARLRRRHDAPGFPRVWDADEDDEDDEVSEGEVNEERVTSPSVPPQKRAGLARTSTVLSAHEPHHVETAPLVGTARSLRRGGRRGEERHVHRGALQPAMDKEEMDALRRNVLLCRYARARLAEMEGI